MANDKFEKMKSTFNRGVTAISIKTASSLEKVKIKTHIESIKSEIERLFSTTGEAAFSIWLNEEADYSSLNEQFELIKQKKAEIAELKKQYDSIDERDSQILGTAASEETAAENGQAEKIVCPKCGEEYTNATNFCRVCGQKLR